MSRYLRKHEKAIAHSVNNAPWVTAADDGLVTVTRTLARAIDELDATPKLFDMPGASSELVDLAGRLTILHKGTRAESCCSSSRRARGG